MKYPKINTIWKRNKNNKYKIIDGEFSKNEFSNILKWGITEKIDGTNIRIKYKNGKIRFDGRTDNAQIPAHLYSVLQNIFTIEKMRLILPDTNVILFGEGYGAKIQKSGGLYRKDADFILFDIYLDGWWLERESVAEIAHKFGIQSVPEFGIMDCDSAIKFVRSNPNSKISEKPKIIEGIVARSYPLMLFRNGSPVMWKIKVNDYK